jgi:hypothetical protein
MTPIDPIVGRDGRRRLHLWRCGDPYFGERAERLREWTCVRFSHWPTAPSGAHHLDLRRPLPFVDSVFDAACVQRVIEHLCPEDADRFVHELARVLAPGAVLRLSFPDLEELGRAYLAAYEAALAEPSEANLVRHEWRNAELFDPMVRTKSGGRMRELMLEGRFDRDDLALRFGDVVEVFVGTPAIDRPPPTALRQWIGLLRSPRRLLRFLSAPGRTLAALKAQRTTDPRETFETHEWMWDAESAGDLLREAGFRDVRRASWDCSAIEGWERFDLDRSRRGEGAWEPATILEAVRA